MKMGCPLLLMALASAMATAFWSAAEAKVPAVYVFGDSTVDVGNNNFLGGTRAKANFPYYGVDFPGSVPTGRFSNGYNGVDFLAMMMGFKTSPPPILSLKSLNSFEASRGLNFASGGSGILDTTGQNVSIAMNEQIRNFERVVDSIVQSMGSNKGELFLSKSIFVLSTGNNDLFDFFRTFGSTNVTKVDRFISTLASNFSHQLQNLYKSGARKFAVVGTTTLGCVPFIRATVPSGQCMEGLNNMSNIYNTAIKGVLRDLSLKLYGMRYSYANTYKVISDVMAMPLHFGYKELESACCGGGKFNAMAGCTPNATLCLDRRRYLFWDGVHPTQSTYRLVAKHAFKGSHLFTTPINIRDLIKY